MAGGWWWLVAKIERKVKKKETPKYRQMIERMVGDVLR